MEWHDLTFDDEWPGGVLELHEGLTAPGPALELHVYARREGTLAVWVTEDGRPIGEVVAAKA